MTREPALPAAAGPLPAARRRGAPRCPRCRPIPRASLSSSLAGERPSRSVDADPRSALTPSPGPMLCHYCCTLSKDLYSLSLHIISLFYSKKILSLSSQQHDVRLRPKSSMSLLLPCSAIASISVLSHHRLIFWIGNQFYNNNLARRIISARSLDSSRLDDSASDF